MKKVAAMALSKKQNEGLIIENRTGATVNHILPDDEVNKALNKIDGNITGLDWEAEIQEPAANMPQLNNNHYAALAGDKGDDANNTKSTGVDNDRKITEVRHDNEITGVDINNESPGVKSESGSMGATYK